METREKRWLTVRETAEILRIPLTRCYALLGDGTLPGAVRIGEKSIRVNGAELEKFLLEQRRTGPQVDTSGEVEM